MGGSPVILQDAYLWSWSCPGCDKKPAGRTPGLAWPSCRCGRVSGVIPPILVVPARRRRHSWSLPPPAKKFQTDGTDCIPARLCFRAGHHHHHHLFPLKLIIQQLSQAALASPPSD